MQRMVVDQLLCTQMYRRVSARKSNLMIVRDEASTQTSRLDLLPVSTSP